MSDTDDPARLTAATPARQGPSKPGTYRVHPDLLAHLASDMTQTLGAVYTHCFQTAVSKHAQDLCIFCTPGGSTIWEDTALLMVFWQPHTRATDIESRLLSS